MKTYELIFGIFTIVGTAISIWQACRAKKFADIAKDAKDSVLEKKQLGIYDSILNKAHDVEASLKLWKNNGSTKQGRNFSKDADKIDDFVSLVNEQKQNFETTDQKSVENALSLIKTYLKDFRDETKDKRVAADSIHEHVRTIASIVSSIKQKKEYT